MLVYTKIGGSSAVTSFGVILHLFFTIQFIMSLTTDWADKLFKEHHRFR